ncbi:MAG TPA: ribosome maturation factor RimP [Thermoanaerobaculia bacterium]|nr:ribosome maturation factor RimP [Thermoanaerobaculia bacterium]
MSEGKGLKGSSGGGRVVDPALAAEFEAIAEAAGCELVQAELKGDVLRLFLDREGGVSLGDCEHVAKQVSALLDVVDFGKSRYVLEVSSPGLDRQLYRPRDYERFVGRRVRVTFETIAGDGHGARKRTVVGRLAEFLPGEATGEDGMVTVIDDKAGETHRIGYNDIRLARLEIEL